MRAGYVDLVDLVRDDGDRVDVRGLATRELTGVTLVFNDPDAPLLPIAVGRRINTQLAAVEALSLVAGCTSSDLLRRAAPGYTDVMIDPTDLEYGAYGPRIRGQLFQVIHHLRENPTSRRAVVSIWRGEDLTHEGDRPCTMTLQFLVRSGRLELVVAMRSQDVWLGAGMDMFVFGQLRDTMARALDVVPGRYVHHVGSLHLYETDVERVAELTAARVVDRSTLPHGVVPIAREGIRSNTWYAHVMAARGLLWTADPQGAIVTEEQLSARADVLLTHGNDWYLSRMLKLRDVTATTTGGTTC